MPSGPRIIVLGANGLIGNAIAMRLQHLGFDVCGQARHFTLAQRTALHAKMETPLLPLDANALALLLMNADIVVNCIGVLQGRDSDAVHHGFAARVAACCTKGGKLLVHLSVPVDAAADRTAFSRTKRDGEHAIAASGASYVILRPGFVVAEAAYGGSALIRALAAWPLELPRREGGMGFAATAISDICETVAWLATRWRDGERQWSETWHVMETAPGTVGDIVALFRERNGGPKPLLRLPGWLMALGARIGDAVAQLGWRPPVRSTAIAEMRRGVEGDPHAWMDATSIVPRTARQAVMATPATVQEKWFARLFLLKALALVTLVLFWCVSGLVALTIAFDAARATLLAHGWSFGLAHAVTIASSLVDISVGLFIAVRRTSRFGLAAGIAVSLGYMAGAAVLAPDLWLEPLGALVKTGPAIVLMLFCLAMADDR
jgi:uncharacterized protein YbjT (DUF2867 family)